MNAWFLWDQLVGIPPKTNSSHLKNDGWNTSLSFWNGPCFFWGGMLISGRGAWKDPFGNKQNNYVSKLCKRLEIDMNCYLSQIDKWNDLKLLMKLPQKKSNSKETETKNHDEHSNAVVLSHN